MNGHIIDFGILRKLDSDSQVWVEALDATFVTSFQVMYLPLVLWDVKAL